MMEITKHEVILMSQPVYVTVYVTNVIYPCTCTSTYIHLHEEIGKEVHTLLTSWLSQLLEQDPQRVRKQSDN